ncbi:MAG: TIGR03960 family B12-binding radical SAM protein [Dehalococcoidales bacterium]|nr:MAG: TIGR03960 family B12-binding radical SAM protein [Dehalococcoidales bacterium]
MMNESTHLDRILRRVTKPARYTGGEWNSIVKDWDSIPIRVALVYPDTYEIGMSNMALPILYELLNSQPDVLAERAFAPWVDMEAAMRETGIPLFSLETRHPLSEFEIIGFSLGYELTYTNVLNMLDLAGIPVLAEARNGSHPLIIAGGSGALNPEPMADFIDLFIIGDGEDVLLELLDSYRKQQHPSQKVAKEKLLRQMATIPGIYVPSLYQVKYQPDGKLKSITPTMAEASPTIQRRVVSKLPPPVTRPVVPYIEVIHDRGAVEIQRGCSHGCRFCQAGMIYRPIRERPQQEVLTAIEELILNCGYSDVSLVSLSTSDYPDIDKLVATITRCHQDIALSLPSLYINSFSVELMDSLPSHKKTGLTFAPEAGSERLRRIINKNVTEDVLLSTAATAFERNWTGLKLYFMLGLPGETTDDIEDIINLVDKVRTLSRKTKGRTPQIRINVSTFVPKPHTPFQWVAQAGEAELTARHELLKQGLRRKGIKLSWQDPEVSLLEATLSRGDRRLGKVIYRAWQLGCTFDSWDECFNFQNWLSAFKEEGLDPAFYAHRERSLDEILAWGHIDTGVTAAFLKQEYQKSLDEIETGDCRNGACNACGLQRWHAACQQKQVTP